MRSPVLPCRHEAAVLAASRQGRLGAELAAHLHGCAACRGAAEAGAALRATAAAFAVEARLPDPRELLRRTADERRRLATERALLPLRLARAGAVAAGAGAAVALLPHLLPHLRWPELLPLRTLLPTGGPAWMGMAALLLAAVVGACWLHWEEA